MNNYPHIYSLSILGLIHHYENRKKPYTILSDSFIGYLMHTRQLRLKLTSAKYLELCKGFVAYYQKNFKTGSQNTKQFLTLTDFEHDARYIALCENFNLLKTPRIACNEWGEEETCNLIKMVNTISI